MSIIHSIFLALSLTISLTASAAAGGPAILAVKIACEKGFLCPDSEVDLVKADATSPGTVDKIETLAPAEKTRLAHLTRTLTTTSLENNEAYALVMNPQAAPIFKVVNTTESGSVVQSSAPAAAALANASTLDMFPAPIGLVASTQDGMLYQVDPLTGSASALSVALPSGYTNGGMSTNDGASRLFLYTTNMTTSPSNKYDDKDDDNSPGEDDFAWFVATVDLVANTVTFSAGAPFGAFTDCTSLVGLHYNTSSPAARPRAAAIVSTLLGAVLGTLDLTNVSNFAPLSGGMLPIIYIGYDPVVERPQTTFLAGDVLYAVMDFEGSDDGSGDAETRMTWVDFSARRPVIEFADKADGLDGFAVLG